MSINVALYGATDRELEESLRTIGVVSRSIGDRELGQMSEFGSRAADVLILDLRDQNALPVVLPDVKRRHPAMGVVIVASCQDPGLMLEAMRAGVTEWVTDLKNNGLQAALERVCDHRTVEGPAGKIFAFLGAKGGVGTTTLSVNIAAALSKMTAAKVLVIDLHLAHGDASLYLGVEPRFSIVDAIQNPHRLDPAFFRGLVAKTKAGPDLLASSDRPVVGPLEGRGVGAVIEFAAKQYQYVVLDVPRSDSMVLDALDSVSRFSIVANQELATVRSAGRISAALRQRYGRERVGIVLSRYDKAADIAREDLAKVVGGPVSHLFPSDYRLAVEALNVGRPLVLENHSRLAGSYVEYARVLSGIPAKAREEEKSGGLFERFGRRR
ncbi:MAG TPA: AAA family ATPase [Vicinamibacterales bacterium]|nr:AAA family ATPase [Vicinamibacterales bacterium]